LSPINQIASAPHNVTAIRDTPRERDHCAITPVTATHFPPAPR